MDSNTIESGGAYALIEDVEPEAAIVEPEVAAIAVEPEAVAFAEAVPVEPSQQQFAELRAPADLPADYELTVQLEDGTRATVVVVSAVRSCCGWCGKEQAY